MQTKLSRLMIAMQDLTTSVANTVEEVCPSPCGANSQDDTTSSSPELYPDTSCLNLSLPDATSSDSANCFLEHSEDANKTDHIHESDLNEDIVGNVNAVTWANPGPAKSLSMPQQIPDIWTFEYQMGTERYLNALSPIRTTQSASAEPWTETNSPFSDHIDILQLLVRQKIERSHPITQQCPEACVRDPKNKSIQTSLTDSAYTNRS